MKKIQQFYIYRIDSSRLKEYKFKIKELTIEEARLNGELISVSDSELVRTIYRITRKEFSQIRLNDLLSEKKQISRRKNSPENRIKINNITKQIDSLLFIPEIISISFEDRRHYLNILNRDGFLVNEIRYIPFMASAGMLRRDSALFIDARIKDEVTEVFENGRDKEIEIVPSKYSAYYSLYSSSTIPVTFPRFAVVPDLTIKTIRKVDFGTYVGTDIDPKIEEKELEIECNAFDGEGLCSPKLAVRWSYDLELDYVPSVFGIRAPFLKGMVCVFDFHQFSKEVANTNILKDIYGNSIDVNTIDCIISESQFKLWSSYSSTEEYIKLCSENKLGWGITKVNPKEEKNYARTSYQFLQVLNLNDGDIEQLCKPTLDWLSSVSGSDFVSSILFSIGDIEISKGWFRKLDPAIQAVLLDNNLIDDSYFLSHLDRAISKRKNDARIGRLIFNGNYQVMISDPYCFASHAFGLGVNPLLKENEHYSHYWQKRNKKEVAAIRSPIVHSSEINVLNIQSREDINKWFKHITSGIIYPASGIGMDAAIHGGSDYDLDLVCTIDSPEIIKGRIDGLPILYETKKADKLKITKSTEDSMVKSQADFIGKNKIGFYTNMSSAFYSLLENFDKESKEYKTILQRLKWGRVLQGLAIDSTKGIIVSPFPEHFVKWKKTTEDMTDEEKEYWNFNNGILGDKRPIFMRFLYSHYNRKYISEISSYDNISMTKWLIPFEKLKVMTDRDEEQDKLVEKYKRKSYFINNDSVMNRISRYIDEQIRIIKKGHLFESKKFDYNVLLSKSHIQPLKRDIEKMKLLYKEWKSLKRSLKENHMGYGHNEYNTVEKILEYINNKAYLTISSNSEELGNLAVYVCYKLLGKNSKNFCWQVFSKEIVNNIRSKKTEKFVRTPLKSNKGSIEYLWSKYGIYLVNIEE